MAAKPKNKMPKSQRAKQFLPFAAVQGLDKALIKKEEEASASPSHPSSRATKLRSQLR